MITERITKASLFVVNHFPGRSIGCWPKLSSQTTDWVHLWSKTNKFLTCVAKMHRVQYGGPERTKTNSRDPVCKSEFLLSLWASVLSLLCFLFRSGNTVNHSSSHVFKDHFYVTEIKQEKTQRLVFFIFLQGPDQTCDGPVLVRGPHVGRCCWKLWCNISKLIYLILMHMCWNKNSTIELKRSEIIKMWSQM